MRALPHLPLVAAALALAACAGAPRPAPLVTPVAIGEASCSAERLGASIPVSSIGEPVSAVTIGAPRWVPATGNAPAHCAVDGAMAGVTEGAPPIHFRVLFPESWTGRAAQMGGGGMNGAIPNLTGNTANITGPTPLQRGFAVYGSDSGHSGAPAARQWALNDEAIRNLGYMQMKKTRDAARVLVERMYGAPPRFTYYLGGSQGGREGLTVAQRYPDDYDGIVSSVPIVSFSSLMLAPELIRIQEKPLARWVTPAKVNAIRGEFMRQCDALDGLVDGLMNDYQGCRERFDVHASESGDGAWRAKRCLSDVDPAPADTTASACLTVGQIATLNFVYTRYPFATPLANGTRTFGMWVPGTDPGGSGLIERNRFRGQEGAAPDAPLHSHLGVLGVTGFLMRDPDANPLVYSEGGPFDARRRELSAWLDATNPDLSRFRRAGGKMIVTIGTNDALASPGAQLDYFQSVLDRMGRPAVDAFARFFVIPQTGHGLTGSYYRVDGEGRPVAPRPVPNGFDRLGLLIRWVEEGIAPGISEVVTGGDASLPLCSYPAYPRYVGGPPTAAGSYTCEVHRATPM